MNEITFINNVVAYHILILIVRYALISLHKLVHDILRDVNKSSRYCVLDFNDQI